MKIRLIPFAMALTLTLAAAGCDASKSGPQAGEKPAAGGAPQLEVVGGDVADWGSVAPGVLTRVIKITNAGGGTLNISEVKPSCGCTTAPLDKKVLQPGDTASMEVKLDVAHNSGPVAKTMTIYSNDSTNPARLVTLKANLVRLLTSTPPFFPVSQDATPGTEYRTSVALQNTGSTPVSVGPPRLEEAAELLVKFDMTSPVVLQPGDSATVVATVRPLKTGVSNADVVIPTDSKEMPTVRVPLTVSAK